MKRGEFYINDISSFDIGAFIQSRPVINTPKRRKEGRTVSGRSGTVLFDEQAYDNQQRQRLLERRVRESKKRIELAKTTEDAKYIQREKKLLDRRLEALDKHVKDNNLVRDYARERISKNYKPIKEI